MNLIRWLRRILGLQVIRVDLPVFDELQSLAEHEKRTQEAVAADLISFALVQRRAAEANLDRWRQLSPREQQVAAMICLDYTNPEVAARLNVSLPTVKTHVRNILIKFQLARRSDLRQALAGWDFSAWDTLPR
jgi:two-component system response regulator NreC